MKINLSRLSAGLCSLCLLFTLAACGTTVEAQQQRFNSNADSMELLATKQPTRKADILKKLGEYKGEQTKIVAGSGDQKKQMLTLNRRMEKYLDQLDPTRVKKAVTGSKLAKPTPRVTPPGAKPVPAGARPIGNTNIIKPGSAKPGIAPVGAPGVRPGVTNRIGVAPTAPGKLGVRPPSGKMAMPPPAKMPPPPPGMRPMAKPAGKLGAPAMPAKKLGAPAMPAKKLGAPGSQTTR